MERAPISLAELVLARWDGALLDLVTLRIFVREGEAELFQHTLARHIPERRPDHEIGELEVALDEGEGRVAMQGGANEGCGARVLVE